MPTAALQSTFPARLLTLSDGRSGLRGGIHVTVRVPETPPASPSPLGEGRGEGDSSPTCSIRDNSCNSCLDFVSSDETLDRYGEIISATGWKLDNYLRNPVFQNSHQYGDIIFTLGKALITEVRSGPSTINSQPSTYLFQRIEFATEANPMARLAYALYRGGFLKTVSVGFIPLRWEDGDATVRTLREAPNGLSTLNHQPSTNYRRRFLEQELLEVSAVAIPANPNALALALRSGCVEKSDLRELSDLLRHALAGSDHQPSPNNYQHLYTLARQLALLMRRT